MRGGILSDTYGMGAQRLADLLNDLRIKHGRASDAQPVDAPDPL
jgi:hypothetical protein